MIRLHVPDDLAAGADVTPSPEQGRYLVTVMRLAIGAELLLFNGRDGEWRATLVEAGKRVCRLTVGARMRVQMAGPDLDLVIALVKRARLETIIEKAAELGARRVRLAITRRTNADHTNVARLQAIAVEAAEQTGRLDVPEILAPEKLDRMLDGWDPARRLVFCDEGGGVPPMLLALGPPLTEGRGTMRSMVEGAAPRPAANTGIQDGAARPGAAPSTGSAGPPPQQAGEDSRKGAILIGPEGGFAPEEGERLRALPFVTAVSLGPRILRADTAAISALTVWQAALGDWR
ncbi:MAG: 16S rRNA (uracil(1498)-N(3))-methyltransferase [Caulobacter sp.]|nr:16S rRNA (uracil(1498)-N(3))-methyltransferase [Caulobacter sp.]